MRPHLGGLFQDQQGRGCYRWDNDIVDRVDFAVLVKLLEGLKPTSLMRNNVSDGVQILRSSQASARRVRRSAQCS